MDRVAVITGASRGIGAATALVLAEKRFRVVVNYRSSTEEADEVVGAVKAAGGEALAIRADVTDPDDVAAMFAEIERHWGRVDVLVHNALIPYEVVSFADLTWEQLGGKLEREMHAAFLVTKAVVPGMISRSFGRLDLYDDDTVAPSPRRHDQPRYGQSSDGPVRPLCRIGGGAARAHRQPCFAGDGGRRHLQQATWPPTTYTVWAPATPWAASSPPTRWLSTIGLCRQRGFGFHHRPLRGGQRRSCDGLTSGKGVV